MRDVVLRDATRAGDELRLLTSGPAVGASYARRREWPTGRIVTHAVLSVACLAVLGPLVLIAINSMKSRESIFGRPFELPIGRSFDLAGYQLVFARGHFPIYFLNSIVVTLGSTLLILAIGAMAAHALAEYRFRLNRLLVLYFALGIMISIRLGSVGIVRLMSSLGLTNT